MYHREFVEAGFRVFPLFGFKGEKCECGNPKCKAAGKHPRASNWQHTPENDPELIEEMEEAGLFKSGYGVLCRGFIVIDVDARNGGVASYTKLIKDIPEVKGAGLIVETGSGGGSKHLYFSVTDGRSLMSHHPDYPGIDFKSSGFVVGPGSHHVSGNTYTIADGEPYDVAQAPDKLLKKLTKPERKRLEFDGHVIDVSQKDLLEILEHIPNDDCHYDEWIEVGMAIHHSTGGAGYLLWDKWSEGSSKYDDTDMDKKWHSFGKASNPVTIGTLIHHAKKTGWAVPLEFYSEKDAVVADEEPVIDQGMPFDVTGIDLNAPPGFVGKLAAWVESRNRRPRKRLSVATALAATSNVMGLRYADARDSVTPNLFIICVAGSRTGKEGLNQSIIDVHRKAGIAGATHGGIKSEQEVIRNLIEHQPALYVIDEIGITLQKIRNAQKKGTAAYLEGVVGVLMSAYSKGDGYMPVSGDIMRMLRDDFKRELAQLEKRDDQEQWVADKIERLHSLLNSPEPGLKNPYLSIIGFTTPITFDELVDLENATNGFVGRCLLFNERETAPRSKVTHGFVKPPMPTDIEMQINALATGGEYDTLSHGRIEYPVKPIVIQTDEAASEMLEKALVWFEDQAIAHKSRSGLESLFMGAYELVAKVSFVLAAAERLRTAEHVRWAFELIRRDVQEKASLVTANEREGDAPDLALMARIANLCGDDDGETIGVIYNRTRTRKKEDVDATIEKMIDLGTMERIASKRKDVTRYRYAGW